MPDFCKTGLNFISPAHQWLTTFNYQKIDGLFMTERPLGVTILGILWILTGLMWLILAFLGGAVLTIIGLEALGAIIGVLLFILGIIDIFLGIGCFMGWGWVWIIGVIFMVINILVGLVILFLDVVTGLVAIIIAVIILWYLFQPNVKAYFGKT